MIREWELLTQGGTGLVCVDLHILISGQEILMHIHKDTPLEQGFSPKKWSRLRNWEFNFGLDFKTCYFDQRPFQFPIQPSGLVFCWFEVFLPRTSCKAVKGKFKKPSPMNMVTAERVLAEIFTCVFSDQNNLSVPSR